MSKNKNNNIEIIQDFLIDAPKYIRKHFKKMKKAYKNQKKYKKGIVVFEYVCCGVCCHSSKRKKEIISAIDKIYKAID